MPGFPNPAKADPSSRCLPQACLPVVAASLLAYALVLQTAGERSEDADDWRESSSASLLWDALTTDEPDAAPLGPRPPERDHVLAPRREAAGCGASRRQGRLRVDDLHLHQAGSVE